MAEDIPTNVGDVRPNHRFDEAKLADWLRANVEGVTGAIDRKAHV